jgi:hypothetical protein
MPVQQPGLPFDIPWMVVPRFGVVRLNTGTWYVFFGCVLIAKLAQRNQRGRRHVTLAISGLRC